MRDFKIGDKAKCINKTENNISITIGKIYEVKAVSPEFL
jgi:hypothetical protein